MRIANRSYITMLLALITICMTFVSFHLYQKDESRQNTNQMIQPTVREKSHEATTIFNNNKATNKDLPNENLANNEHAFVKYSSDEHLRSLLYKQSNSLGQVIATIIGGDSYSLFAWDWYERMLEISNETHNCHCFLVAMDEIAVILALKRGIPVYYSTISFDQQMEWINTIEARQHSLYRVGHAKFDTSAKVLRLGYSIMLSEMDVFWRKNPLDYLKQPLDTYDLQISHHYGAHPRVNIGLFFVRSSNMSISFFTHVAEFWVRYGKGGYLSDQRVLDALLKNYDQLDKTYLKAMKSISSTSVNWTAHDFGNHFSHMMTDGSAFILFDQAAKFGRRSKKFHGDKRTKFFTVTVENINMSISYRNLLIRSLLIIQHKQLKDRILILPAFSSNLTATPITYQLDIKKFLLYWTEENIRLPNFMLLETTQTIPIKTLPYSSTNTYKNVDGILNLTLESIPLDLPTPSSQFEVHIRDSLLWCSPPNQGGIWCIHHPRDFGATMEILFACRGDPYPPCANKTEKNEQFLQRPYEKD